MPTCNRIAKGGTNMNVLTQIINHNPKWKCLSKLVIPKVTSIPKDSFSKTCIVDDNAFIVKTMKVGTKRATVEVRGKYHNFEVDRITSINVMLWEDGRGRVPSTITMDKLKTDNDYGDVVLHTLSDIVGTSDFPKHMHCM